MFRRADLVLITKTDLLPYLDFDLAQCEAWVRRASPGAQILQVSARTGAGMAAWYGWLRERPGCVPGGGDGGLA
jgi:hydrogenase nickel incorporation protein HypB